MTLEVFLKEADLSVKGFAEQCCNKDKPDGLTPRTIQRLLDGLGCNLTTAALVRYQTRNIVDWEDMLPVGFKAYK